MEHVDALVSEFERLEEEEALSKDEGMIRQNEVTFIERMRELTNEDDNDLEKLQQEYNVKLFEDASHSRVIRQLESDDVLADIGAPGESAEIVDEDDDIASSRAKLGTSADALRALDNLSGLLVHAVTDEDGAADGEGLMDELLGEAWGDVLKSMKDDELLTGRACAPADTIVGPWVNEDGLPLVLGRLRRLTRDLDRKVAGEELMPSVEKEEKEVEEADEGVEKDESEMTLDELEALERRRLKRESELKVSFLPQLILLCPSWIHFHLSSWGS